MTSIPQVAQAMQIVLRDGANSAADASGFIQRQRTCSGAQFVQTLVVGWLAQPHATYHDLVETAADLGVTISPHGLAARLTFKAADCLFTVLQAAISQVVTAQPQAIPLLNRFSAVYIQDSTTIALPDERSAIWQGWGGAHGRVRAALTGHVRLALQTGQREGPLLQDGRANDKRIGFAHRPPTESLILRDLGSVQLPALAARARDERCFLTRLDPGTALFTPDGVRHDVLALVEAQASEVVDIAVRMGVEQRVAVRLLAVRVPEAVAAQRLERLTRAAKDTGRTLSAARAAAWHWTLVVTNVAAKLLRVGEALVLLQIRWQIALLFTLWKSEGQIDSSRSVRPEAVVCERYAKLIAMSIQHWMRVTSCWEIVERSLPKAARVIRRSVYRLGGAIGEMEQMTRVLEERGRKIVAVARQNSRTKQPNAYKQLLDPPQVP